MRWVWDETGDDRVVKIWDLRERMSQRNDVVYGKWYQNRATFFSPEVFPALLSLRHKGALDRPRLTPTATELYEHLLESSPQSTKSLRQFSRESWGWEKKTHEAAMKELWQNFLIVGRGEVDDGAFPSLNVGATALMFEELWEEARTGSDETFLSLRDKFLPIGSPWRRAFDRVSRTKATAKKKTRKGVMTWSDINTKE